MSNAITPKGIQHRLMIGREFPYGGVKPKDAAERAAQGCLADLLDRRGIKWSLQEPDEETQQEIADTLAAIIREAMKS